MSQENLKLKNVNRIAILRANALGDFIVTLPAIKALRQTYPQAEIVLLGRQWHKDYLVQGRSCVDRVVLVPIMKNIRNEGSITDTEETIEEFFSVMEKEKFDVAVSFQGNGISAVPFIKRLKAKLTIGNACDESDKPDRWLPFYYYQSEVLRYQEIVSLIGAHTTDVEPQLNVLEEDRAEISDLMLQIGSKPFVVLHPFATDIRRSWPLENFRSLAEKISEKGLGVVFTGSVQDREKIDELITGLNFSVINTSGKIGLGGLTALLANASLLIASDTGPLHLARAVNTATVGIYWAPNLVNWGPLTRTLHRPVASWELACPDCGIVPNDPYPFEPQNDCPHMVSFVRNVKVEQVMKEAEVLLAGALFGNTKNSRDVSSTSDGANNLLKLIA